MLQEKLFARRIVLITGQLDDAVAADASGQLLTLGTAGEEPIDIHLDSPDGTLESAFVLIDALDMPRAPVRVRCRGQVGGPVLGVLAAAHLSLRVSAYALQPTAEFSGTPDEIASYTRQQQPPGRGQCRDHRHARRGRR